MNNGYFEKCHLLMNKLSKQNKQMMKLQVDFTDLKKENNYLKEENNELKSKIKDLKFENDEKYRQIQMLEQMLQDVER